MTGRDPLATRAFWGAALARAVRTAAQTAAASIGVGVGLFELAWLPTVSVTGAAALLSLLTSIAFQPPETKEPVTAPAREWGPVTDPYPSGLGVEVVGEVPGEGSLYRHEG